MDQQWALEMYTYVIVGIFGLLVGSFLNVCIYRIPEGKSVVRPPSTCGHCGTRLKAIDLVPVLSYFALRGKCRHCKHPISFRYAMVEALTAMIWISLYWKFGGSAEFFGFSFLMSLLVAVFFIDLDHYIIPNGLVITGLLGGAIYYCVHMIYPISYYESISWWNPIIGMFVASFLLFVIAIVGTYVYKTEDAMGMGDVKIFLPIGLFLGWKMCLLALIITIFSSSMVSILLVLFRVMKLKGSAIPLGPFIVIGVYVTIFYGKQIVEWYFHM